MLKWQIAICFWVCVTCMVLPVNGQSPNLQIDDNFQSRMQEVRQHLLSDTVATTAFRQAVTAFQSTGESDEDIWELIFKITNGLNQFGFDNDELLSKLSDIRFFKRDLYNALTNERLNVIKANSLLISFISLGVFDKEYPYPITSENDALKELDFYDMNTGSRIAEIGAGLGAFSYLIALTNIPDYLATNELTTTACQSMFKGFEQLDAVVELPYVEIIDGRTDDTNLQGAFDYIILRDVFHHFLKPELMLQSILEQLSEEGELLVLETPRNAMSKNACKKVIPLNQIKRNIRRGGFVLVDHMQLNDKEVLLKYKKR